MTWCGAALTGMGAVLCRLCWSLSRLSWRGQCSPCSPSAATVVTIMTAPGDGRDKQQTAVATMIMTAEGPGGGARFPVHKDPRHQAPSEWIVRTDP